MSAVKQLLRLRSHTAKLNRVTVGLKDGIIEKFAEDPHLKTAIADAEAMFEKKKAIHGDAILKDEADLLKEFQEGFVNFYHPDSIMPFVPLAAKGPWVVTLHGAVMHDSGGYGMLGFGHNPDFLMPAVGGDHCMANVMTPSFSQVRFTEAIRSQIGWSRGGNCPYAKFVCMNSGSEAVEFSARVTDVHAKNMTSPGAPHEGRRVQMMCMQGGFYGRTYRPARLSESCRDIYKEHLASFQYPECHAPIVVEPNNIASLEEAFAMAEKNNIHIEALYIEPVMGEGQPGKIMNRDFYDKARELTKKHHSLLIIDSIQASLRATGSLSVCDYPGFEDADAPDMETYSKALNAGQYPLSVLAVQKHVADTYVTGLYGNTMTTNPRALDVATETLSACTPEIRTNILKKGDEFQAEFQKISEENPNVFVGVTGSGLLQAIHLNEKIEMFGGNYPGTQSILSRCRQNGLGVINAAHTIKFTPHFEITSEEIGLIGEVLRDVAKSYES
eukprot:CAMPEP_0184478474 /NCGR_PEP_ID=MMETSP0113_2-20130426/493_1 /TAXON_ID=91329 /ORGANISM="Norrisiella sphaerica, Strain BC52" /LENGTH=499 /DNA_ID=CAMNT_0026856279 /DNA_START=5 /DNA_END=1504 /DNA_ORIENTATION=+